jgi:hypothetical protein
MIPQNPTPEQRKRAKDIQDGVWCPPGDYSPDEPKPGDRGKAEAEKRYGKK